MIDDAAATNRGDQEIHPPTGRIMSNSASPPPPLVPAHAVVHAGTVSTPYLRYGGGEPLILLAPLHEQPARRALFASLAASYRVLVPTLPVRPGVESEEASRIAFSAWLRGLLDGLGVSCARIVADEGFAVPALSFALADPERVGRLVLFYEDAPDPALGGAPCEQLDVAAQALLVVRTTRGGGCSSSAERIEREVMEFLGSARLRSPG